MNYIVITILIIAALVMVFRFLSYLNAHKAFARLNHLFGSKQPIYKELGIYEEALPHIFTGTKKPHGTLIITGYGSTPFEFASILPTFKHHNMYYYIPRTVGWGRPFFQPATTWKDWVLTHVEAYLLMKEMFENVSIISHSTGCNIACMIASHFPVQHLILSGPNLIVNPKDEKYKKMVLAPVIKQILPFIYPIFNKPKRSGSLFTTDTLYEHFQKNGFFVESLPVTSLQEVWELQEKGINGILNITSLTLLCGENDNTVGNFTKQIDLLKKHVRPHVPFKTHVIKNAGHNIYEENPEIVGKIFMIIKSILNP